VNTQILTLILAGQPKWHRDALCAQVGGDLWFPDHGDNGHEAKLICLTCPVRAACLQDALDTGERHGIRGGLSGKQRKQIRRNKTTDTGEAA
jgi:WhiB family redox-sensing transcriptional regulator